MKRSERLKPIAELAAQTERDASRTLAETRERLQQHEQQLTELVAYRREYEARISQSDADPVRLQDFVAFMARLTTAVTQQSDLIARTRDELARHEAEWSDRRVQRKALDTATERYARAEAVSAARTEQQQVEEIAAQLRTRSH